MSFRHAICNEIFKDWDFAQACRFIKQTGYHGIEIAHFTLADDPASITPDQRREHRKIIEDSGLTFVGLHWIMVAPAGLHVTTPDNVLREKSWRHIDQLIDLCADLGPEWSHGIRLPETARNHRRICTREEATGRFVQGLASVAPNAQQRGVTVLVEALPSDQTDVVLSLAEAASIVEQIGSPAIRTMFDTHNAVEETEPHDVLVDRYFDLIRHVHVNETDGGHCGTGDYDFKPVLRMLEKRNYRGWVSLEAFRFEPEAETIARESLNYLKAEIEKSK